MEKYVPCKWEAKESLSSNLHIRQERPENKEYYKRQGRTLHNDQGINPRNFSRSSNNCNYLCSHHRGMLIYKLNVNSHKRRNQQ